MIAAEKRMTMHKTWCLLHTMSAELKRQVSGSDVTLLFALHPHPLFITGAAASTAAISATDATHGFPISKPACRSLATPSSRLHARSCSHRASAHDAAQPQPATNRALCNESTWQPTSGLCCFPSESTVPLWCAPYPAASAAIGCTGSGTGSPSACSGWPGKAGC